MLLAALLHTAAVIFPGIVVGVGVFALARHWARS